MSRMPSTEDIAAYGAGSPVGMALPNGTVTA